MRRLTMALLLVGGVALVPAEPVAAETRGIKDEGGVGTVVKTPGTQKPGRAPKRTSSITCTYHDPESPKLPGTGADTFPRTGRPPEGGTVLRVCEDADGMEVSIKLVELGPRTPTRLAQEALSYTPLPQPTPVTSPPDGRTVVNFPTWLAVDDWSPVSATASVAGLTATVVAEPKEAIWRMGDGGSVTCRGPGRRYQLDVAEEAQSTDCSYTYRRSSAGEVPGDEFRASVTVVYAARWSASDGSGGDLGTVPITSTFPMRVGEIQAVNVRSP